MLVNEIFESIQGEGKYCGHPVLFIRLSGCTRACSFCDTKYHTEGKEMIMDQVTEKIKKSKCEIVVWTGGEPMLQQEEVLEVIAETNCKCHHIETNGDILPKDTIFIDYIAFSPKDKKSYDNVIAFCNQSEHLDYDIKVVTDLKINKDMIENATILMPLSTFDTKKDLKIQQDVWNYCVKHIIKYTPRIHKDVWGNKKGI